MPAVTIKRCWPDCFTCDVPVNVHGWAWWRWLLHIPTVRCKCECEHEMVER